MARTHGAAPYRVVVVHGGPGAGGEMAPVARELARKRGVLEPIQSAASVEGQIEELRRAIEGQAAPPVALIGHSWGAWLSCLLAAGHPALVAKLVLVASGPFEERYVAKLLEARLGRLTSEERKEYHALLAALDSPTTPDKDGALARLGELCSKVDSFEALPWETREEDSLECDAAVFEGVWNEAAALRRSGELLARVRRIACPVVAIHGSHDPHPAEGVRAPLSVALPAFRFVLIERCGHTPWLERHARAHFFRALEAAIA